MGKKVIYLPSCHSTNDVASDLIRNGSPQEGTVVITDHQTAGKGQRGNSWYSEPKKNLTFSIILHPRYLTATDQFYLNIVASLAIYDVLSKYVNHVKVKWPNDIYVKSKKIAGILIQNTIKSNRIEDSVLGIGLNINQQQFELESATSIFKETGIEFNLQNVLADLIQSLENNIFKLRANNVANLKEQYLSNLLGYEEERLFKSDSEFRGRIIGISKDGKLQIETFTGLKEFNFKEVSFL
ncbi:MAG: biotin--[acetyl-CoA-carboxylase] ligase [Fulvivirga sp.]|uniref:biotin--[acetyl-CoA-carboxylase] ligase n=1 Tax=Fulvivirga sp. TaxID=1931237 RepID=UPI0032EF8B03